MIQKNKDLTDIVAYYNQFTNMTEVGGQDTVNEILRGHSMVGFLGRNEDIIDVKEADYETLQRYGVSYEQIASPLERILESALPIFLENEKLRIFLDKDYSPAECSGEPCEKKRTPRFMRSFQEKKMLEENPNARYEVIVKKIGDASCPWSRLPELEFSNSRCDYGDKENYDFNVKNLETGKAFHYNLLQVHMIREHMFFEGRGTNLNLIKNPYRIEPEEAIEVLGLIKSKGDEK